jgi:hypothetical protein
MAIFFPDAIVRGVPSLAVPHWCQTRRRSGVARRMSSRCTSDGIPCGSRARESHERWWCSPRNCDTEKI